MAIGRDSAGSESSSVESGRVAACDVAWALARGAGGERDANCCVTRRRQTRRARGAQLAQTHAACRVDLLARGGTAAVPDVFASLHACGDLEGALSDSRGCSKPATRDENARPHLLGFGA